MMAVNWRNVAELFDIIKIESVIYNIDCTYVTVKQCLLILSKKKYSNDNVQIEYAPLKLSIKLSM